MYQLKRIGVPFKPTKKIITVINEDHMNSKSAVKNVTLLFDIVTTNTEFLAVERVPVDLMINISSLERLHANLDHFGNFAEFKIRGEEVRVGLQLKTGCFGQEQENSAKEDFTTDLSSMNEEISDTESTADKEIVISLA